MIGRLVHEQEVWSAESQPGKDDATPLAIREVPDRTNLRDAGQNYVNTKPYTDTG